MKDPAAVDFLEKSMIVLTQPGGINNNSNHGSNSGSEQGGAASPPMTPHLAAQNSAAMQLYSIAQLAGTLLSQSECQNVHSLLSTKLVIIIVRHCSGKHFLTYVVKILRITTTAMINVPTARMES